MTHPSAMHWATVLADNVRSWQIRQSISRLRESLEASAAIPWTPPMPRVIRWCGSRPMPLSAPQPSHWPHDRAMAIFLACSKLMPSSSCMPPAYIMGSAGAVFGPAVSGVREVAGCPPLQVRAVAVQLAGLDVLAQLGLAAAERARLRPADLGRPLPGRPIRIKPLLPRHTLRCDSERAADGIPEIPGQLGKLHPVRLLAARVVRDDDDPAGLGVVGGGRQAVHHGRSVALVRDVAEAARELDDRRRA